MRSLGQVQVVPARLAHPAPGTHPTALFVDLGMRGIAVGIMMSVEGSWCRPLCARRVIVRI